MIFSIAGAIMLAMLCAAVWYLWKVHPTVHIERSEYPIVGIDVSKHNGDIDFKQVAADSIRFVYIKATEGASYKDPKFETNLAGARNAGLAVGAYHYFRLGTDGVSQAESFHASIHDKHFDMPIVIDVEVWGNDLFIDRHIALRRLELMVYNLKGKGHNVMIYTNGSGHKKYIYGSSLHEEQLWICSFKHPSNLSKKYHWEILQYSHWGQVSGIKGDVDLDVFNGTEAEWMAWTSKK